MASPQEEPAADMGSEEELSHAEEEAEEAEARALAETKKKRMRERIAEIRSELQELLARNEDIPEDTGPGRLSTSELVVDQEHVASLVSATDTALEAVRTELAWPTEFHERGLAKLKEHFLARLDLERIEVRGFRSSPHRVSTFRCPAMSEELQASLARLHELIFAADREAGEEANGLSGTGLGGTLGLMGTLGSHGASRSLGASQAEAAEKALSTAQRREMRRQQRQDRKKEMVELERARPSDSYEDPQDLEAMATAEATLGNYLLKTSDSYQVPESGRMNAEKKRRQMFLLEESMHAIKSEFNQRVLALRDFRQQVRAEVGRDVVALREIDEQLGTSTPWLEGLLLAEGGDLAPPEFPERRFAFGERDLTDFAREKGIPYEPLPKKEEEPPAEERGIGELRAERSALASRRVARLSLRAQLLQESGGGGAVGAAVLEEALARLRWDKQQLEDHIRQILETFNNAVASIEKEKAKLESDLKNADLKLLVLYEELLTLNELEERDEALLRKATKCRQDKTSIMHQIKECQDQLGERKAEIEQWHSEEQNLQAEFTQLVGEASPFFGALLKVYKKKVKRSKRKKQESNSNNLEEDNFEEEDEEEEDDSDLESDDMDDMDDMDEGDTGPPQGCDVQIYDGVVDLREKRLDMEDALQEIQRAVEELKKTHKKLLEDERRTDKEQKQTDAEIQHFQTDKQRKLNQVEILFALRLSQVQCMEDGKLPGELDKHVVFTREGLGRLMSRITELHQEIKDVKASHRQLQRDFRTRKKEKNLRAQNIEDLQAKFQDIQLLKFGQTVQLDLLEKSAPTRYATELQERVAEAEVELRKKTSDWEKRIEKQKKELAKLTCENTSLMEQIVSMGYSQMQLDTALNARVANVTVNDTEPLQELREMERQRLKDFLALQSKEIATLQAEIGLFRKKGGHIYTTVTANRSPEASAIAA